MKKKTVFIPLLLVVLAVVIFSAHEVSVRYFQDKTCVVCHEMREPIRKWQASGTAKNHGNCAGCHFDPGFKGWMDMNKAAVKFLVVHFQRDPQEPLAPKPEPLFLEEGREPGYWSHVPNHRCFDCKSAKNHQPMEQAQVHGKLLKNISAQPCKDCHNHEMRNDQKFYEKVTEQTPPENFDPVQVPETVPDTQSTALHGVPTMFIAKWEAPETRADDLSTLPIGIMAGPPRPIEVIKQVADPSVVGARKMETV